MISNSLVQAASHRINAAYRILVVSHIRPDGDSIGSMLGLGLSLQEAGKEVQFVSADGVPTSFRHLIGSEQIRYQPEGEFDLICFVDCSDLERAGQAMSGYPRPDLNIDHHVTNLDFAEINLVDIEAVATAEIIADLLSAIGLPITEPVASSLMTGLITDTLGFRTSNMTPKALRLAADLMEEGANLPELYRKALVDRSFEAARYWGAGLSKLERDGRLVWTTLTRNDREKAGYSGRDDADLINILASIKDANVALIFVEQPNESVKVSWRAQPGIDVSPIAVSFGGGGHPAASGAEIPGDLEDVKTSVLNATRGWLMRNGLQRDELESVQKTLEWEEEENG